MGLIGNPVQTGSGPAAVTPTLVKYVPSQATSGEPFSQRMPLFRFSETGRLLNVRRSQKTCLTTLPLALRSTGTTAIVRG